MSGAVATLARLIEEVSGNVVPEPHHRFLAEAAARRVQATRTETLERYVEALADGALPAEWGSLLPLVTVNESYLFRTPQHFAALDRLLLPRLLGARAGARRLRVWSAGCARGEEPATLAIVLAETSALVGWEWRVLATDVDEEALAAARRGRYLGRAVAGVPPALLARHFVADGEAHVLAPDLLARIDYRVLNLVREPFPDLGGRFDFVFLRNVLIYFRPESQRRVAAAVAATLADDGYLFLGPAETLWQISEELEPVDLGDCFCYRRKSLQPPAPWPVARGPWPEKTATPRRQTSRATVPSTPASEASPAGGRQPSTSPIAPAGHGSRATGHVSRGTRERLEEAVRLLLADRLPDAVSLLEETLAHDPAQAEAHALEGYIHDLAGRTEMAIASFRASLYLDLSFYQVRLLLADALRRLGWEDRARHEYRTVLAAIDGGAARGLAALAALPLPDLAATAQRARAALVPQPAPGKRP